MILSKISGRLFAWRRTVYRRLWLGLHGRALQSRGVFILGAQRSGTTMLAACLEESPAFDVYGEKSQAFDKIILKDADTVRRLIHSSPRPFVAFKPLTDSHRANYLLSIQEGGKAIWMYRRPEDRANSAVSKFGDTNLRFLRELAARGTTARWEACGVTEQTLGIVRRLKPESMDPYSAAAAFWFLRNQLFFDQHLETNSNVLLVKYEELVTSPEPTMKGICSFLGCEFLPRMIGSVHAKSVGRSETGISEGVARLCSSMLEKLDKEFAKQWRR